MKIHEQLKKGVNLTFKEGLSSEYIDLVTKILKFDPEERLPLIKVFDHPWVVHF